MRFLSVGAVLALVLAPASALAQDAFVSMQPEQLAQIFCIARLGNDMAPVEAMLTPDLAAAVAEADRKNAAWADANPGEKPPLGDGIPWQAWPDYADGCTVGAVTLMQDESSVKVDYTFSQYPDANFSDTLQLRLVDDASAGVKLWRLDNIAYATDSDLRAVLLDAFVD